MQVSGVLAADGASSFKKVEYIRFPLRLGDDVFKHRRISSSNEARLVQLLSAFKILIDLYRVDAYRVCATAAFRNASNRQAIVRRIQEALDVSVAVIDGAEEAWLIHKAIYPLLAHNHSYLHVDVGGGSTEVSVYMGCRRIASHSFDIGAMRMLGNNATQTSWNAIRTWLADKQQYFTGIPVGIATGGNIRRLAQLAQGGSKQACYSLTLDRLAATQQYVATHSLAERIEKLAFNPDRAEVILPATEIYNRVMRYGGVQKILVPDVGLRDGIITVLYEQASRARGDVSAREKTH